MTATNVAHVSGQAHARARCHRRIEARSDDNLAAAAARTVGSYPGPVIFS